MTDRHRLWNRLVYYFTSEEVENMRPHKGKPDTRPTVHPHPTGVQAGPGRAKKAAGMGVKARPVSPETLPGLGDGGVV